MAADVAHATVDVVTVLAHEAGTAAGTKVVLTWDGYILTKNQVVEDMVKVPAPGPVDTSYLGVVVSGATTYGSGPGGPAGYA